MLIQLSLSFTLLITKAFVNICLMVLSVCDGFSSSSESHFLLELPMIITCRGAAYKLRHGLDLSWCYLSKVCIKRWRCKTNVTEQVAGEVALHPSLLQVLKFRG